MSNDPEQSVKGLGSLCCAIIEVQNKPYWKMEYFASFTPICGIQEAGFLIKNIVPHPLFKLFFAVKMVEIQTERGYQKQPIILSE